MIEILYLFLGYLPLTLISLTEYSFLISNSFIFSVLPLVSLYHYFTPYPVYYDVIAILSNYIISLVYHYILYNYNLSVSKIVLLSIKFLTNYFTLFIFLGIEYIYRFNNVWESSFGLLLLSFSYLYYPFLHRIYYGHNKNSWKRKIDYYYSYYKENFQFSFIFDLLEGLVLGILSIEWYNNIEYVEYFYMGVGILKLFYHYFKPINYVNSNYFMIINIIFTLLSIGCVFANKYNLNFIWVFLINGIIQLFHNLVYNFLYPPKKHKKIIRESISLPNIYFGNI